MADAPMISTSERAAIEQDFRRAGLPHLAADYDPREDTLTRLWPVLVLLLVVGLAIVLRPDWAIWQRGLAALAGGALALGGLAVVNLLRGRPATSRPEDVGYLEAAVLVLTPAAMSLVLGDDPARSAAIAGGSLAIAIVGYALTSGGVLPMVIHQLRPAAAGTARTVAVALRALPPLIAVLLFLALAGETWRAFGRLEGWRFGALIGGFGLLIAVIVVFGLARERRALYRPELPGTVAADARDGAASALVARGVIPRCPPLSRLERINVGGALLVSLVLRVVIVGATVGLALIVIAVIVMDRALTAEWTGAAPEVLLAWQISGREVVLTAAAVRVAVVLGAFSALYFVAVALAEERNREQFLDDELGRIRRVMATWAYYRGALDADRTAAAAPDHTPSEETR